MGLGAELCALAAEAGVLDVPPVRVAMPDIPGIPVDDVLEDAVLPNRATIRAALVRLARAPPRSRGHRAAAAIRSRDTAGVERRRGRARRRAHARRARRAGRGGARDPALQRDLRLDRDRRARRSRRRPRPRPVVAGERSRHDHAGRLRPGGSDLAIPFVRPGQTAAVRIGAVRDGRAYVACAVDHRAVDGADAGRFLAAFKTRNASRPRGRDVSDRERHGPSRHPELVEGARNRERRVSAPRRHARRRHRVGVVQAAGRHGEARRAALRGRDRQGEHRRRVAVRRRPRRDLVAEGETRRGRSGAGALRRRAGRAHRRLAPDRAAARRGTEERRSRRRCANASPSG